MEFAVGMCVKCTEGFGAGLKIEGFGIIKAITQDGDPDTQVGVHWTLYNGEMHTLNDRCPEGHGWWVHAKELSLVAMENV